jgi:serine/threonine-protein kinase HipA
MALTSLYVFCYLPGEVAAVPAGRFDHDGVTGVGSFAYGRHYVERPGALAVDPVALPLGVDPMPVATNGGLYGAFRDASPDYWGRLVIASGLKCPVESLSEVDYLLHANATRVGNLDFRAALDAPEPTLGPPEFQEMKDLLMAADDLEAGRMVDERRRLMLEQGSSLGGARPKCTVQLDGELWLAKLPSRNDRINMPRLEFGTLRLAVRCGLDVPEIRLRTIGGRDVFLARRFDRQAGGGGWARRGYLSALSLAQWDERDRDRWSYRSIAERIRKYSLRPSDDLRRLFCRIAFNILVRNTDDHPRNHGFLVEQGGLILSPLFDVEPSLARPGVGADYFLAMSIGPQGRLAALGNLRSVAATFNLKPVDADDLILRMQTGVATGWRDELGKVGFDDRELDVLAPSFETTA